MEQFALIAQHPPDQYPKTNETIRKVMLKVAAELPQLGKKIGVEILAGPLISADHRAFAIVRGEQLQGGPGLGNRKRHDSGKQRRVDPRLPMEEALKETDKLRPIY